jgi:heme O synthase-like polyprenyltransferase
MITITCLGGGTVKENDAVVAGLIITFLCVALGVALDSLGFMFLIGIGISLYLFMQTEKKAG